jgi:hypothetical protein
MTKKLKEKQPINELNEMDILVRGANGLHLNTNKDVEKAKIQLEKVKEIESERIKNGFIWVSSGKTSKLVNPDKAKLLLKEGWKKLKIKRK